VRGGQDRAQHAALCDRDPRAEELKLPPATLKAAGISDKELQMALSLVEGMSEEWKPEQYHDTYKEDVLALVKKKIKAGQTKTITAPDRRPPRPRRPMWWIWWRCCRIAWASVAAKAAPAASGTKPAAIRPAARTAPGGQPRRQPQGRLALPGPELHQLHCGGQPLG
jgi:hypothetical protein